MKTGFIYIWYDRKRKMYYLGCHWGKENDGYICSSNRMRDAFRRRQQDFKRRIIQRNIDRKDLLSEEHKWLSLIQDDELGKKYYNLSKKHFGHWSNNEESNKSIRQKLSEASKGKTPWNKGKPHSEETKQKMRKPKSEESKLNMSKAKLGRTSPFKGKNRNYSDETRQKMGHLKGKTLSDSTKKKMSDNRKNKLHSDEWRKNISISIKKNWEKRKANQIT